MNQTLDVIVVGAGPAGLATATATSRIGLSTLLIDEQSAPGGQIYRNIEAVRQRRPGDLDVIGRDYARGARLAARLRASRAAYLAGAAVWRLDADDDAATVSYVLDGRGESMAARHLVIATGAMERPVPIPGWTLPGVMTAGAAQIALKSAGLVPEGRVVLAGRGPLLLLAAVQLIAAGAEVAAVLQTTDGADTARALSGLPQALPGADYLLKGLSLHRRIRRARVPLRSGVRDLAVLGEERATGLRFTVGGETEEIPADLVLLHDGVVPHVQATRQLGCRHVWSAQQRCWRPETDSWGRTSMPPVSVAGDCGAILGAAAAEATGALAALDIAHRLGRLSSSERNRQALPLRARLARHRSFRRFLDRLYPPSAEIRAVGDDATIVCRCEEVTAGEIRRCVGLGAMGPNQLKAFTRAGMGPCQGRMCGLTVAEIVSAARGRPVEEIGYWRVRPPIKPITLGELAAVDPER